MKKSRICIILGIAVFLMFSACMYAVQLLYGLDALRSVIRWGDYHLFRVYFLIEILILALAVIFMLAERKTKKLEAEKYEATIY